MYKDKDKQREAGRERARRYRENRQKALLSEGVTRGASVTPKHSYIGTVPEVPGLTVVKPERTAQGNIRVSKPGDADYVPMCETTRAFIEDRPKAQTKPKRGLDIKCFEDLSPDVQATIRRVSESNEEFKKRVKIAIHYQHVFPGRYEANSWA